MFNELTLAYGGANMPAGYYYGANIPGVYVAEPNFYAATPKLFGNCYALLATTVLAKSEYIGAGVCYES